MAAPAKETALVTALVTGASAGLGAEFARQLAASGHDLILSARRTDRLDALAAELRTAHAVAVTVIAADLADPAGPDALVAAVAAVAAAGLTVDLLVNNAGLGHRGAFATAPAAGQLATIDVNVRAAVALAHAVLPGMVARGHGGILTVASTAAFQPGPWMAVYYASKAFVLSFSEALHEEVKGNGVRVAALCPGPVDTEFAGLAGMTDMAIFDKLATPADKVVRDGLAALAANRAVKVSGAVNAIAAGSVRFAPRSLVRRLTASLQKAR